MEADPFKPLQDVIDQEHTAALGALEILRRYISHRGLRLEIIPTSANGSAIPSRPRKAKRAAKGHRKSTGVTQTFREQVDAVVKDHFCTIDEIATATGLDKKQVRGVVYSPILSEFYHRKKESSKGMTFKLKAGAEQAT